MEHRILKNCKLKKDETYKYNCKFIGVRKSVKKFQYLKKKKCFKSEKLHGKKKIY